jgi:hypothetical protein
VSPVSSRALATPIRSPDQSPAVQVFLCWLLYFYVALSMRENVLSANGSQVRLMWIYRRHFESLTWHRRTSQAQSRSKARWGSLSGFEVGETTHAWPVGWRRSALLPVLEH